MNHHRRQYIHLLLQVILLTANCLADNLILSINFERRIFVTNGAFLSLTLDPATLLNSTDNFIENIDRHTNMVRGLAPGYVRFGGPRSNSYIYDIDVHLDDVLYETHSTMIHRWAEDAGLDVIACISPRYIADKPETHSWESTSLAQLLSFNDRTGHNASWQLGYECQERCDLPGADLGRYVADLRATLKTYPRYSDSLIIGPDIVAYKTARQRQYLRDYLSAAGDALSAITWHPELAGATIHGNDISVHADNIAAEKDELDKVIGDIAMGKPLWIAESKPEECKHRYLGALTWMRRLGNAAKLGVQVVMRQFREFSRPTPDYWVSFLHKALVGREVLEVKVQSDNESHVHFYSQCTRPSALYEKGAVTIFGVNLTPREVTASLQGFKIKTFHEYILSPDSAAGNKMLAERVLLNGEPFDLIDDVELPDLTPEIVTDSNGLQLKLASGNIGFWVIPNAKVKACTHEEEGTTGNVTAKKLSKRHVIRQVGEEEEQEEDVNSFNSKKLHAKQERTKWGSNRIGIRKWILKTKLYRRIKQLLQKNLQQKQNKETSTLSKPITIIFGTGQNNTIEEAGKQQNIDNRHSERTEKPDDEAKTNDFVQDIQDMLKKYNSVLLSRKYRVEAEHRFKREVRHINNAMTLISKIGALLRHEKEVTSNDIKDETSNAEDTETNGEFNEKFSELAEKFKASTIEEIEKYFNILYDLLEDNKLTTTNIENNQISVHENSTNKKRYVRDLSKRSEDLRKDTYVRRLRMDDLKDRIKRKIKRWNEDKRETSSVASDLKNLDKRKSTVHSLFRQYPLKMFLRGNGDPQHSVFSIQERERATRDLDRMLEIGARKEAIFRKRSRIDVKSKRKDDFKREGMLSLLNPRITDSDESFLRQDSIREFPKGDVFVTTGVSAERNGLDYDYVEDDEDDSRRKDQQEERESTVESVSEDVPWIVDDQRDYMPNEFYENVHLPNARIRESTKDYDDLYEAEFVFDKQEDKNNDGSATNHLQPLDEKEAKRVKERSTRQLIGYHNLPLREEEYNRDDNYEPSGSHSGLLTLLRQLTEIPTTKYDFINYKQISEANPEAAKRKLEAEPKFSSFFYQLAPVSHARDGNFQALSVTPDVEYMKNSINNRVLYNKRNKRSYWKKLQGLFAEEMIKEDPGNFKDCHCRVIRARNSPKKHYNNRVKRDQTSVIEFADSEAADANANANPDLMRSAKNVPSSMTKEEFDRIMTGEILPSTSVIETNSDYNKRDAVRSNKSHRRANEAMQTMEITSTPVKRFSGTSDISAQRVMEKQMFFRAQPSAASSEIEEATYDSAEAALEVSSRNKENQQEPFASDTDIDTENAQRAYLCEETQDFKEETQEESTDVTEGAKMKGKRYDDCKVSSKSSEETTKSTTHVETETSKRAARKTIDYSRSNRLKTRKESKEAQQSESSPGSDCEYRARVKEKNDLKTITSVIQNIPKSQLRDLARYEERLMKRAEQIKIMWQNMKKRQEKRRNDLTKTNEQTRNLKRRQTWENFCENNDFCHLTEVQELFRFLANEIEDHVDDKDNDKDKDVDDNEEDRYFPIEHISKFLDNLLDQRHSHANVKNYPEYDLHYYFFRHPKVLEIEQEPVTSTSSDRKIFAIDPSMYRGGEPVLEELHKEYLEAAPKYSSKIKLQNQAPKSMLKDFYRTLLRSAKVHGDQQIFKSYDNYSGQEYARKSQIKDAYEQENAVVLYLLDNYRPYDLPEKLSRIYLSVLDRRHTNQAKDKTSDSNNGDAEAALTTAGKIGLPKKIDKEYTGTNEHIQYEELGNHHGENVGEEIDKSYEINDKVDDNTGASNMKARNTEEGIVDDDDSETNGLLDTLNTILRSRRKAEEQMADKSREQTRRSKANTGTDKDHDRFICMKKDFRLSSEQSIPLYQLTRLSSDAVLFRNPKDYVGSSRRDFDRQGKKQSSKYVILMPDKIKDMRPYEMLGARNPERSPKRSEVSSWLDRYLPERMTNAMIRYLNDVSSEELDYEDPLDMLSESAEETSDEQVSYSSEYSDESNESKRKIARNVADEVNHESREEDQQYGVKSKEFHEHLKIKGRMRSEERRAFMPLPEANEKTKRRRRQAKIDQKINKSILTEDAAEEKSDEYYLQQNSINEKGTTTIDYPRSQKDGKVYDDLLEDFAKSQKNVITSTGSEGNNESLENSIAKKSDKTLSSFMKETIPKLQDVIMNGLEKAKDLTESVEQFVDNFEENFNETSAMDEKTSSTNKTSRSIDDPFHLTFTNIKKLFRLFTGISQILYA